jgi:hypothetical protein
MIKNIPARMVAAILLILAVAGTAHGFGTVSVAGQNAEHERITRRALGCEAERPADQCFQADTLDILAGKKLSFGAVGAPDNPTVGLLTKAEAHCDGGDFLNVPGYPQSEAAARQMLIACRAWMKRHLDAAVAAARPLVSNKGKISRLQASIAPTCVFAGRVGGRAKCNVLENFGIVLHASQDFYSHTNWTDKPHAGSPTAEAPPGLGHDGSAPWLDLRTMPDKFPAGLISGCFESASIPSEDRGCNYGPGGKRHRVKHASLNKDKGAIGNPIGPGTTPRGQAGDNFARAAEAATKDTRDKWATLQEALVKAYGPKRAKKMICVLTHDEAVADCAT